MTNPITARRALAASAAIGALVAMTACSSGGTATSGTTSAAGTTTAASDECAAYATYGDLTGKTISVFTSIASDAEAKPHTDSYKPFEKCTGATIKYEGSATSRRSCPSASKAGNAPDIAYIPQPGLLTTLVNDNPGKVFEAGDAGQQERGHVLRRRPGRPTARSTASSTPCRWAPT